MKNKYIYANSQILAQHDVPDNNEVYFYLHDRLGSVRMVIDANGTVKNHYTYDPWGLPVGDETQEIVSNLYLFAGYIWDANISQYHCYRRQYDPVLGRFTSRDPAEGEYKEPMTLHKYLYCLNNPINKTDPRGERGIGDQLYGVVGAINTYQVGLYFGLEAAGGNPSAMLNVAIGANALRKSLFDNYKDEARGKVTLERIIAPKDLEDRVSWECIETEGFYRHCTASCRLRKISGSSFLTLVGALEYGNDWPSSEWTTNNTSDVIADMAGIAISYIPGVDCRTPCKQASKAASYMMCPKK